MDGAVGLASAPSTWTLETAYQYATQRAIQPAEPDGEPLYNCPFPPCAKQFSKRFNLKAHLRVHTGDKPFACAYPGCSRRFMWKSSLTSHHTGHSRRNAHMAKRSAAAAAAALARAANAAPSLIAASSCAPTHAHAHPATRALPAPPFRRVAPSYHPSAPPAPPSAAPLPAYAASPYASSAPLQHTPHPPLARVSAPLPRAAAAPLHAVAPALSHSQPLPSIQRAHTPPTHAPSVNTLCSLSPAKAEPHPHQQAQPLMHGAQSGVLCVPSPSALAAVTAQAAVTPTPLTPARELLHRDPLMCKSPPNSLLPSSSLLPSPGGLPRSPGAFGQQLLFGSHTASPPCWTPSLPHGAGVPRSASPRGSTGGDVPMAGGATTGGELSPLAVSPGVSASPHAPPMLAGVGGARTGRSRGVHRASKPPLGGPSLTAGASALLPPLAHVAPKNPPTHIDLGGLGEDEASSSLPALGSPHTELSPLPVASPIFGTSQTPTSPMQPFSPFSGGHVSSAKCKAPTAWYQA